MKLVNQLIQFAQKKKYRTDKYYLIITYVNIINVVNKNSSSYLIFIRISEIYMILNTNGINKDNKKVVENQKEEILKFTKEFEEVEYTALAYSGLKIPEEIFSIDVPIGENNWVHEIRCGFQNQKELVLLHGYGGTSMTFIRIFKELSSQFRVHALDALGMGLSSRKPFLENWSYTQMIDYFTSAIENWRISSKISKFTLGGHSFGGYLAACYAQKYPERIERLILMSPAGVKYMTQQIADKQYQKIRENATLGRKMFLSFAKSIIKCSPTPSGALNTVILGNYFLDRILEGRLKLKQTQKQAWRAYYKKISQITPNSQKCFFKIFHFPGIGTQQPIQKKLKQNKFPFLIEFYYGDGDWMEKQTAKELCKSNMIPNKLKYSTVVNSGHQIIFQNPQQMAEFILVGSD